MKKIVWGIVLAVVVLQGCKKDDDDETTSTTIIAETTNEQNAWDDSSISKFLDENYFDDKGNIVAFDASDDSDNTQKKLSEYDVQKLPSGVVCVKRPDTFQPDPGKIIGANDKISIMQKTLTYIATKNTTTGDISLGTSVTFSNTIAGADAVPVVDPSYYYVKNTVLAKYNKDNSTSYDHSFYEIEGLREGLTHFKAFDLDESADYNLQGVIIVPSRAAFARDTHYPYGNYSWTNRTFVFNFQIYKTETRKPSED